MKRGLRTTEFWWGALLSVGIWWLVYTGNYPEHGSAASDGIEWLILIWGSYTGYRGVLKRNGNESSITTGNGGSA